jgi:hypothetical protein
MPYANPEVARQKQREYYQRKKAERLAYYKEWYAKNRDHCVAAMRLRYEAKKDEYNIAARRWHEENREIHCAQMRKYQRENRDRLEEAYQRYYLENKARYVERAKRRREYIAKRTPPWADLDAIRAFYRRAAELTVNTGTAHHVDHIVPLRGKLVSGLHVAENLRVVPAKENLSKSNRFDIGTAQRLQS